jgi:hypothetical protein
MCYQQTNKQMPCFSTTTIYSDNHPQPQPTTLLQPLPFNAPNHHRTHRQQRQRHVSSPTADSDDLARQQTWHVVQTVTTQSSSLSTLGVQLDPSPASSPFFTQQQGPRQQPNG